MAALSARGFMINIRLFVTRTNIIPYTKLNTMKTYLGKTKGLTLSSVPKLTLACWGVGKAVLSVVNCQEVALKEAELKLLTTSQRQSSVLSLQLHRLRFALHLGLRSFVLFLKFSPLLLLYPLSLVSHRLASLWLDLLLWAAESSGPTFIKLGQWASTRRDLFSEEFCDRFSRLHVRVQPHSWAHTKRCLRKAFGEDWRSLFQFESKEPVGSGCVAQVYRALAHVDRVKDPEFHQLVDSMEKDDLYEAWEIPGLRGVFRAMVGSQAEDDSEDTAEGSLERTKKDDQDGEHLMPVAIKVLHPGIARQVRTDLLLMKTGSWLIGCLPGLKWLSLYEVVEEFEKLMTRQIDLRYEARNMERFQENFQDVDFVKFPTPLRPFITRNILVETFEESDPISKYLAQDIPAELKQKIARMGVDTLLKMVFVDNFVHGDLHPGNILVQCEKQSDPLGTATLLDLCDTLIVSMRPPTTTLHLVLLDTGIVAELQERDLHNFRAVFTAVVLGQGERVAELILHHARASECRDVERFKCEMAELVNEARKNTVALGKLQVGDLLSRVFKLLITHKVKLESNFASIVFAIVVLEGLGRSLDPHLDILEIAKPLLLKNCASLV
ncbi:putative aarF domain-containing protein kinase 2 isoform X2 [Acipenser oxyrinchus oxyrinchus]|uniref:AarF domain-containing protein kinase 2 isoform X2 n=1 Tax=Acipenser oxyrinchus oxyrinchus TaxID=40147 RepID=A0AAD8DFP7_ACIOX|nr:putative aarF domain-containing protein kinase 2 isoform X2 [Acipenser oxyrinchus oxyrinchus]